MPLRWVAIGIVLGLANSAHAAVLRASAEPPLSVERLGDVLRSYLDGIEVTVITPGAAGNAESGAVLDPGVVGVSLRGSRGPADDAEVVLVDGEETIVSRLPGALRTEDLYRAAALKVQALLQRRAASVGILPPAAMAGSRLPPAPPALRDRLWLDSGFALLLPSDGLAREGLRLGAGARFRQRGRLGLGTYLEPPQSTNAQGINVSAWELPVWLSLGYVWHRGRWLGWLDAVGHVAVRRVSAEAAGIVDSSDTALSPRAGGTLGIGIDLGPGLRGTARVSFLATLVDARYRVDGQVVWPAARTLLLCEVGIEYGVR